MHELLVAFAFVTMVACPAIVALLPQSDVEENPEPVAAPWRSPSSQLGFTCRSPVLLSTFVQNP
jgi:hypothetical protein